MVLLLSLIPATLGVLAYFRVIDERISAFALIITSYGFLGIAYAFLRPLPRGNTLEQQIKDLSVSLTRAAEISAQLNEEILARTTEVQRLKTQSIVAKKVLSGLTQEEYDAVVAAIRVRSGKERRKELLISFLLGVATNILTFFLLGG